MSIIINIDTANIPGNLSSEVQHVRITRHNIDQGHVRVNIRARVY